MKNIQDILLSNKRVIIREDFNAPLEGGAIKSLQRIEKALPTLQHALAKNAAIVVLSHLGSPKKNSTNTHSLSIIAHALSKLLDRHVPLLSDISQATWTPGSIALLENTRFFEGECACDPELAKHWAQSCDVFVMDAFAVAHRKHASTAGIAQYAKEKCAGFLMQKEIETIDKVMHQAKGPLLVMIGGSKISTKIKTLSALAKMADHMIIGGAMANTCLYAKEIEVGISMHEKAQKDVVRQLLEVAAQSGCQIHLPIDVRVAKSIAATTSNVRKVDQVLSNEAIFDIGPQTVSHYSALVNQMGSIIWNGPFGAFENPVFRQGTTDMAKVVAHSSAYVLAGGGDTILALELSGQADKVDFISTGGGAFLSYLSGAKLPGMQYLI